MARHFPESFDQLQTASPIKRLASLVYDSLIIIAVWIFVGGIAVAINGGEAVTGSVLQSGIFVVSYLFFAYFWTRSGQTLGMQSWRLRVQTPEGYRLTATQSLIRFLAAGLSLACLGAGYLWMFIDRDKLSWHDRLSGSCIVELPKKEKNKKK